MKTIVLLVLAAAGMLSAQTFEVASVRRSAPEGGGGARSTGALPPQTNPSRINYLNVNLKSVLAFAYGVDPADISGPQWLGDEKYDIVASVPPGAPQNQVPVMLQHLLTERFRMAVREETKAGKGFALVAGKGAPKVKPAKENGRVGFLTTATSVTFTTTTMAQFARTLSRFLGSTVTDETGMPGAFDIPLNATMSELQSGAVVSAIQDLGLKLEPRSIQVKALIVEKADKVPTDN